MGFMSRLGRVAKYWMPQWALKAARNNNAIAQLIIEQKTPEQQAASQVLRRGRTVYIAIDSDGKWRMRRRAKQIKREFGHGVAWSALPKDIRAEVGKWRKAPKMPWWWIH